MIESTPRHSLPRLGTCSMDTEEREEEQPSSSSSQQHAVPDFNLGFGERALSAAGAAFLSAIIVNPLDVVKTRLQAQAAGVPYSYSHHHLRNRMSSHGSNTFLLQFMKRPDLGDQAKLPFCPSPSRNASRMIKYQEHAAININEQYSGTLDVFYKVVRQEGFGRLWRGTNAALALAIPTVGIYLPCYDIFRNWIEDYTAHNVPLMSPYAPLVAGSLARSLACISCYPIELARTRMQAFKESGMKPPGVWKTLLGVAPPVKSTNNQQSLQCYRTLWTGVGAQLARDVPFSAICWSTLEPIRRKILGMVKEDAKAASVVGANFSAGFLAGSLAAFATCPLDVAKTRRQIEKNPARQLNMTTWKTLGEIWRDGRMKGLFTGVIPRVARAGPSVGIVVSFYEVVKYALHRRHATTG